MRRRRLLLAAAACLAFSGAASAHEGTHATLAALDAYLQSKPDDVDGLLTRAALLRREGHPERALADVTAAAKLAPASREVVLERALVLAAQNDVASAEADLDRFLTAGPPTVEALEARGRLRESARRFADARADYDAALRLRPTPELYLARGRADEAQKAWDRAAAGYDEGLRALGGALVLRLALIRTLSARGHFDRAIATLDEAIAMAPLKADLLLLRADLHDAARRPERALADRAAALRELDETLARRATDLARITRARALFALGRAPETIADLEPIVARSPALIEAKDLLDEARLRAAPPKPH